MKNNMLKVFVVLALGAVILIPGIAGASYTIYTDEAAFKSALATGYYFENFATLPPYENLGQTVSFGPVNGFSYDAYAENDLYSGPALNINLSTLLYTDPILITFTGSTVYAFGGQFFTVDEDGSDAPGTTTYVTFGSDTIPVVYNATRPFLGIISTDALTSVSIASEQLVPQPPDYDNLTQWPAVDNFYVGLAAVPVPPTVLLLGSGLLGLVGWRRFRKSS